MQISSMDSIYGGKPAPTFKKMLTGEIYGMVWYGFPKIRVISAQHTFLSHSH